MTSQRITFANSNNEKLSARLDMPLGKTPEAYALFAHCFTCSKNIKAVSNISKALNRAGIAVLRFDFTGLGESEGDFAETNFSSNVADLLCAADFLKNNFEAAKILIGHSLGGAAVLQAAQHLPDVEAIATIGAPADPGHLKRLLGATEEVIQKEGEATISLAGREFKIKKQFLDDLEQTKMVESIRGMKQALLIFHSPIDNTVGIENAGRIFEAARHPKSFISLDHADHLLMREEDSRYVGTVTAAWATKYLDKAEHDSEGPNLRNNLVIAKTGATGYTTEINAGGHSLIADEPLSVGGGNQGPSPYGLLSAALGACTSMTLRMYADRKGWPLESVEVRLTHQKIHAQDCTACETQDGKIDQIERDLRLTGPLDESQKQRLLEIADRCPVHRTLHSEISVVTRLAEE